MENLKSIFDELNEMWDSEPVEQEEVEEGVVDAVKGAIDGFKTGLTEDTDDEEIDIEIEDDDEASAEEVEEKASTQFVCECVKCGGISLFDDAVADKESGLANIGEPCRYCETEDGYKVLGTLVVTKEVEETKEEPVEEPVEEVEESLEELEVDEKIEEGIFDSKATKEKQYNTDIKNATGSLASALAFEVAGLIIDVAMSNTYEQKNSQPDFGKNAVLLLNSFKANQKKNLAYLLDATINFARKYAIDSNSVDRLNEVRKQLLKMRTASKTGAKSYDFVFEKINEQVLKRIDQAIKSIKREYGLV